MDFARRGAKVSLKTHSFALPPALAGDVKGIRKGFSQIVIDLAKAISYHSFSTQLKLGAIELKQNFARLKKTPFNAPIISAFVK